MFISKSQLSNDNSDIQDKARYFSDSFDFLLAHMGNYGFPSLENHRSVLEKIRFQLADYDPRFSNTYIKHHIKSKFLDKSDLLLSKYYKSAIPLVQQIRTLTHKDLANRELIITQLGSVIEDMEHSLLKNAMEEIHIVLHCEEGINAHQHTKTIEYACAIVITEFRFAGLAIREIQGIFDRLLSKKITLGKRGVHSKFPLPAVLRSESKPREEIKNYYAQVEAFMENRTLREQFDGIVNLFESTKSQSKVLYRILNLKSKVPVSKSYGKVKVTTAFKSYVPRKSDSHHRHAFFTGEHQVFIEATVNSIDLVGGEKLAIDLINHELAKFEVYFNCKIVVDYTSMIMKVGKQIATQTKISGQWLRRPVKEKNIAENRLARVGTEASAYFLHLEHLYVQAKTSYLPDLRLTHYWRYIEATFASEGLKSQDMQEYLSEILSNHRIQDVLFDYRQIAEEILWENRHGIVTKKHNLGYHEITKILNGTEISMAWLTGANEIMNHPFLKSRLRALAKVKVSDAHGDMKSHFMDILQEAYEQRNFIQHSGTEHRLALEKLLLTLPGIVESLRQLVLSSIQRKKLVTYAQILADLRKMPAYLSTHIAKGSMMEAI